MRKLNENGSRLKDTKSDETNAWMALGLEQFDARRKLSRVWRTTEDCGGLLHSGMRCGY